MSWKSKVPGGFGTADVKFAGHPLDKEWAEDAISDAKESGATFDDMANEMEEYLLGEHPGASQYHIDRQVDRARDMW
ncbi:hypothetical protein DS967_24095 [Escherichia coli]|uniref:hypothetical protein n=1 Tax=Enterobacteriaceae TaxID=543 RepID=UPI000DEB32E1|nr:MULTISPECIES: hypothetical protein [Enterobacteriaceae]EEZ5292879.1 hypothetical protein [Escherichia coli]EFA6635764.1 hypothetical protein [Escherichia coli]EFB2477066.1 hypothetical protein [Escherichia coli]EFB7594557.1 hypothetical protein [Escherichia coli]EFH6883060.1 hypothetical protein [Escherichia coli]